MATQEEKTQLELVLEKIANIDEKVDKLVAAQEEKEARVNTDKLRGKRTNTR